MEIKTGTYNSAGQKWCGKGKHYCHTIEFGKNNASNDGIDWICRSCRHNSSVKTKEEIIIYEEKKNRDKKINILRQEKSTSITPCIPWSKLLQTKLFSKPNYPNQHIL